MHPNIDIFVGILVPQLQVRLVVPGSDAPSSEVWWYRRAALQAVRVPPPAVEEHQEEGDQLLGADDPAALVLLVRPSIFGYLI